MGKVMDKKNPPVISIREKAPASIFCHFAINQNRVNFREKGAERSDGSKGGE